MSDTADNERADPRAGLSQASMIDRPTPLGTPAAEMPDLKSVEPPAPRPPAPAPRVKPPKARGGGFAVFLTLLLSGGLGAAGYYAWTHPSPDAQQRMDAVAQQAQTAADHANTISEQLAALTERVDKLEKAPPPTPVVTPAPAASAPPDLGDLPKRLDDLTAKVDALASRPEAAAAPTPAPTPGPTPGATDNSASQQALTDLTQRVSQAFDAQKAAVDQLSTRLDQLAPRIGALEQGEGKQKGTAAEIARLARIEAALVSLQAGKPLGVIAGAPPEVARFATVAPPTEASLRESFPALAEHAQAVSAPDLSGRSFWQRAFTRLQSAVTVRQGPDVLVGDPAAGILSDARQKVQDGDLVGAVTALRQLTGPAAEAMQGWVEQARALVAARAALADLAAHA